MRRRLIIISTVLVCVALALLYVFLVRRQYASSAMLDISQQNSAGSGLSDLLQSPLVSDEQDKRLQTEERVMQSAKVLLEVSRRLDLIHKEPITTEVLGTQRAADLEQLTPHQKDDLVATIRKGLSISVAPGTTIVVATYQSVSPELARDVPNTLIDTYIGQNLGSGQLGTRRVSDWLQAQTDDLRKQVEDSARKLADFQREHNLIGVDESQNVMMDKLRLLNEQLGAAQAERISKETNYRVAQTGNAELMGSLGLDPQLQALRAQQQQLQSEYTALTTRYGQGYPRVSELAKQLAAIQAQVSAEVQRLQTHFRQDYEVAKENQDRLSGAMTGAEKDIFKLDEGAADYAILRHNAEATRTLYDEIEMKVKESGIMDTLQSTRFRIVDDATLPSIPVSPRKRLTVLSSIFAGLLLGLILAFIRDAVDDAVFSGEDLEKESGLPVLGVVPHLMMDARGQEGAAGTSVQMVDLQNNLGGAPEAFRALRSAMLLGFGGISPRLQVITSTTESEGKSLVAVNYARVLAQSGARVLLIDGDLRRGSVHRKFNISTATGLTNLLSDYNSPVVPIQPETLLPTLRVLPRGPIPPNPADLLASSRFMELIAAWQQEYDYVIVDSAPILPVSDTLPIAQKADLVFMVVRVGVTSRAQFLRIRDRLYQLSIPVKGIILNDVTKASARYNYYYYGNYKYEEADEKQNQ